MEYRITYKCRLCGEKFDSGATRNYELAVKEIACAASNMKSSCHILFPHHCNDNDIGMADFIGIKGYEV